MTDKQTIIIAISGLLLTFIFGLIAVIQTYRANKLNRLVLRTQGALETPNIDISLFNEPNTERFILALPLSKDRVLEMPLLFNISNSGAKSARDVEVYIRIPKELCYGGSSKAKMVFTSGLSKVTSESVSQTDFLETIMINMKTLHPNQGFQLSQTLSISDDTFLNSKITVPVIDGSVDISYTVEFAYRFDFGLFQADYKPISKGFSFIIINTSEVSVETFFENYNKRVQTEKDEVEPPKTLLRRLLPRMSKEPWYRFKLVRLDKKYIEADSALPINRVSENASLSISEGIRIGGQYIVPALKIGIGN